MRHNLPALFTLTAVVRHQIAVNIWRILERRKFDSWSGPAHSAGTAPLLVADRHLVSIQLGESDRKFLVIRLSAVLEIADRKRLA